MAAGPSIPHNHLHVPPLPKPPGDHQYSINNPVKPARRVSFSELPAKPNYYRPATAPRQKNKGGCCCSCCMWTCLVLLCFVLMLALAGALFFGYFQPHLPDFRVERLNFSIFNVSDQQTNNYQLTTEVNLLAVASNVNQKIDFTFSPLMVYVLSENVNLGRGEIPGFSLGMQNMVVLKLHGGVTNAQVDNAKGESLRREFQAGKTTSMNVDVFLSGTVRAVFGKLGASTLPITVTCKNVNVYEVGAGVEPLCKVQLMSLDLVNETNLL